MVVAAPASPTSARAAADLGRAIRHLRTDRGLTQAQLAAWLTVTRQTVISMERGGPVSLAVAMRALGILGGKAVIAPKGTDVVER